MLYSKRQILIVSHVFEDIISSAAFKGPDLWEKLDEIL